MQNVEWEMTEKSRLNNTKLKIKKKNKLENGRQTFSFEA